MTPTREPSCHGHLDTKLSKSGQMALPRAQSLSAPKWREFRTVFIAVIFLGSFIGTSWANVSSSTVCDDEEMWVEVMASTPITGAYLQGLKNYPDASCRPQRIGESHLQFRLSLKDFYRCGTTQILNKITGTRTFYNRLVITTQSRHGTEEDDEELVLIKCQGGTDPLLFENNHLNSTRRDKRDVLPAGFQEPENVEIRKRIEGRAPEPELSMLVRQDGRVIGQELLVQPGAPLTMEVNLDERSKDIYGILVSQLEVTDTGAQSEVILLNGCTVDPYLFENFLTNDGDLLEAKFRAFKFPDTNYVLFRGTVNVCLGSCNGIDCSNGQTGFGRRRRSVDMTPMEKNRIYEVKMTTILRIDNSMDPGHQRAILGSHLRNNEAKLTREDFEANFFQNSLGSSGQGKFANCLSLFGMMSVLMVTMFAF